MRRGSSFVRDGVRRRDARDKNVMGNNWKTLSESNRLRSHAPKVAPTEITSYGSTHEPGVVREERASGNRKMLTLVGATSGA